MAKKEKKKINRPLKKKPQNSYNRSYQPPMASTRERVSNLNIHKIVERILSSGQLSRQEYVHLITTMLCDYHITDEERPQLNRVFDNIQSGQIKFVD
jgi:hypothetical protein